MAVDHTPKEPVVEATADEFTRTVGNNTAEAMTHWAGAHEVPTANYGKDVTSISDATEIATSRKENETCQGENGQEVVPLLVTASSNTTMLQNGMSDLDVNRNLNQRELEGEKIRDRAGDQIKDSKGVCRCK